MQDAEVDGSTSLENSQVRTTSMHLNVEKDPAIGDMKKDSMSEVLKVRFPTMFPQGKFQVVVDIYWRDTCLFHTVSKYRMQF